MARKIRYGDEYWTLHDNGHIERTTRDGHHVAPSASWRVTGAVRYNNFGRQVETFSLADVLANDVGPWQYANGKQRVHIVDFDHGSTRVWMQPSHAIV